MRVELNRARRCRCRLLGIMLLAVYRRSRETLLLPSFFTPQHAIATRTACYYALPSFHAAHIPSSHELYSGLYSTCGGFL